VADFPALPLWTDAFMADTSHLSATETGAYISLLMAAWRSPDCALPNDEGRLARMARCDGRTWRAVRAVVMAFWKLGEDGLWRQKRLSKERDLCNTKRVLKTKGAAAANEAIRNAKLLKNNDQQDAERIAEDGAEQTLTKSISISNSKPAPKPPSDPNAEPAGWRAGLSEDSLEWKLRHAANWWHKEPGLSETAVIQALIDNGHDLEQHVLPTIRAKAHAVNSQKSWSYFIPAIRDARVVWIGANSKAVPIRPTETPSDRVQFAVFDGSPEMDAWERHQGKPFPRADVVDPETGRKRRGWYFPTQWPPGHTQQGGSETKSELPEIPIFLDRRKQGAAA
jgi:uncharacterized protein YdaU (DUF1376 family)